MVTFNNPSNNTTGSTASGVTNTQTITNPSNTASSQATQLITVGGTSSGDVWTQWSVGTTASYALGLDNSASQVLNLNASASGSVNPSSGTNLLKVDQNGSDITQPTFTFTAPYSLYKWSTSGQEVNLSVVNTVNAAGNDASVIATIAGNGGGQPYFEVGIDSSDYYALGIPQSNTEGFILAYGNGAPVTPSTGTQYFIVSPAGVVTSPITPSVFAFQPSAQAAVTGSGTEYIIGSTTALSVVVDQNTNQNTNGTFTAPSNTFGGNYFCSCTVSLTGLSALTTSAQLLLNINSGSQVFQLDNINPIAVAVTNSTTLSGSCVVELAPTDTVTFSVVVSGAVTDIVGVDGNASPFVTFMNIVKLN